MGKTKGPYNPEFTVGSRVRIAELVDLEEFSKNWKYHHPLRAEQIQFEGSEAKVLNVMFYHGSDELYELSDVPGIWHEECLRSTTE